MIEMRPAGAVGSALPHTVSQALHANHDSKQPRSRQGDGLVAGSVCVLCRLASSRLAAALRPICVTRRRCSGSLFFLRRGIPEDLSVAASA